MKSKFLSIIWSLYITCILSNCGYQVSTNLIYKKINDKKLTIYLHSYDPFHSINRVIKNELYLNNINVISDLDKITSSIYQEIPRLNIDNISKKNIVISMFPNGLASEYLIILKIQAKYFIPHTTINYYPITIQTHKIFLKDPEKILPNLIQENEILEVMYKDIAHELIQKFLEKIIH